MKKMFTQAKYPTLCEALQTVVAKPIVSVDFVEDYVQLRWQGTFFTAFTMLKVLRDGVEYAPGDPEYRHVLYRIEGEVLLSADVVLGHQVNLVFPKTVLRVSLRDDDYVGPEAVQFGKADSSLWVA